jgi:hypothetical protein
LTSLASVVGLCACTSTCASSSAPPRERTGEAAAPLRSASSAARTDAAPAAAAERPRLVFTPERIAAVKRAARAGTPAWRRTLAGCQEAQGKAIDSGYQGWAWAHAIGSLTTCWHATGDVRWRAATARYLAALLDDRDKVGDGAGGDRLIERDHGYGMRTHAVFAALAYDWLHGAPELDPALQRRTFARLDAWIDWYKSRGYLRDQPLHNHMIGYFAAAAISGIATAGDAPRAAEHLRHAREDLLDKLIAPTFATQLAGGGWPEGWQYGDHVAVQLAWIADAERRAGRDVFAKLPWLRDIVRHHAHALLPDGRTTWDGGDWSEKPAKMPSSALWALAATLPDAGARSDALGLARALATGTDLTENAWLAAIADDPAAAATDPRQGALALHLPGMGLTLARSGWKRDATFVGFQSGPVLTADHQHSDQGHFEIWRGQDGLITDPGAYGAASSMSHNTLLIDDGGQGLAYSPNQGRWGTAARTSRFHDAADHMAVRGDFADAYRPYPASGKQPTVEQAQRDLVFVRPGVVVVRDRVRVTSERFRVSWALHGGATPVTEGPSRLRIEQGSSRADVALLAPEGARFEMRREPTPSCDGPWCNNDPEQKGSVRVEAAAPPGTRDRTFLSVVAAGARTAPAVRIEALRGESVEGALVTDATQTTIVAFARDDAAQRLSWTSPMGARHVVAGLSPNGRYVLRNEARAGGCTVSLVSSAGDSSPSVLASAAGTVAFVVDRCASP